ncbi:MAG: AsmA family protein [Rubrivivax sp.]|nr:AsmA family protein [Rubrivivax sp.]
MNRPLRIALLSLAAAAALLLAGAAVLVARFDGDDLAKLLGERMQQDHGRRLHFAGGLTLRLWPRLAVTSGAVSLSERGSERVFAEVDALHLAVEPWPLLQRRVVVDRVELQGLRATLTRRADGSTSIDDLLAPRPGAMSGAPGAQDVASDPSFTLALAGVQLRGATLVFDDRQSGRRWELGALEVQTGPLAAGQAAELRLRARLRADRPLVDAAVTLAGTVQAQPSEAARPAATRFTSPQVDVTVDGGVGGAKLRGSLATPLALDLGAGTLSLPEMVLALTLPNPRGGSVALQARGDAELKLDTLEGTARLAGRFDDTDVDGQLRLHGSASPSLQPSLELALKLGSIDLDRYLPAPVPAGAARPASAGPGLPDLTALRGLDAAGQLQVQQLAVAGLKAGDVQLRWRAQDGRLVVDPLSAALYQGRLAGSASLTAAAVPRIALRQRLSGVAVGPLLKDALGSAAIEGRGDVVLDLTAQGRDADVLKRSLAGSGRVELRDGLVRGVNVAQVLRQVGAAVGGRVAEHTGTGSATESTDFSELSGSFTVSGGVARNDDLAAQLPLLRLAGAGTVDLVSARLDYLLRASVVETLQGQGGAGLQALRGLTLPVRLSGPLDAVQYRVDLGTLVEERARQALREKGRAVEERAKQDLADKLKDLLRR